MFGDIDFSCTFVGNRADSHGNALNNGGAVHASNDADLHVVSSTFRSNVALSGGGAISAALANCVVSFVACRVAGNSAAYGGAVYSLGYISATDSVFQENRALITDSANAAGEGAAMWGSGKFLNCSFVRNDAETRGGAAYLYDSSTFEECTFEACAAPEGAMLYAVFGVTIVDSVVQRFTNKTTAGGVDPSGAFTIDHRPNDGVAPLKLDRVNFQENDLPVIFSDSGTPTVVRNCLGLSANDIGTTEVVRCNLADIATYCPPEYCSDTTIGVACYCTPDGVPTDPQVASCDATEQIVVLERALSLKLDKDARGSQRAVLYFSNQGDKPLNWSIALVSNAEQFQWVATPMDGILPPCEIGNVTFLLDPSTAQARSQPYELEFVMRSSSFQEATRAIPITISTEVVSNPSANHSFVTVMNADRIVASEMFDFVVTLADESGKQILDAASAAFSGSLLRSTSSSELVVACPVYYIATTDTHRGTCALGSLTTVGEFNLSVVDSSTGALVGGALTQVSVTRCPKDYYLEEEEACQPCPSTVTCAEGSRLSDWQLYPGYWRSQEDSAEVLKCRYGVAACPGVNQTTEFISCPTHDTEEGGVQYCSCGFVGPLCGECDTKYHLASGVMYMNASHHSMNNLSPTRTPTAVLGRWALRILHVR